MQKILVIDDHELVLGGTLDVLRRQYSDAEILTAQTAQSAQKQLESFQPDLVVMDLSIPEEPGVTARTDTGIQLLKTLMKNHPTLNFVVQSANVRSLVRIRPEIDAHKGGFTVADKSLSSKEMLTRVDWALQGLTHTKDIKGMKTGLEVKPEWLTLIALAFQEELQDKAIAERMCVSERMVRHYWTKVQDALDVYPDNGKNIRIQTEMRAREEGLIDWRIKSGNKPVQRGIWRRIKAEIAIWRVGALPGIAIIGLVLLARLTGSLQSLEWSALDSFLRGCLEGVAG